MSTLPPAKAYEQVMALIAVRFRWLSESIDSVVGGSTYEAIRRAEAIAMDVRKIAEAVAFAVLSGVEWDGTVIPNRRATTRPLKLLRRLSKVSARYPGMMRAQDVLVGGPLDAKATFRGAAGRDVDLSRLEPMWGRASQLLHERHPERLTPERIRGESEALVEDARLLRSWLWNHLLFVGQGQCFVVQMGQLGRPGFFSTAQKVADLPT